MIWALDLRRVLFRSEQPTFGLPTRGVAADSFGRFEFDRGPTSSSTGRNAPPLPALASQAWAAQAQPPLPRLLLVSILGRGFACLLAQLPAATARNAAAAPGVRFHAWVVEYASNGKITAYRRRRECNVGSPGIRQGCYPFQSRSRACSVVPLRRT